MTKRKHPLENKKVWVNFDDDITDIVKQELKNIDDAYLLFYKKVDMPTSAFLNYTTFKEFGSGMLSKWIWLININCYFLSYSFFSFMKEARKTGNIIIREASKKNSREDINKSRTSVADHEKKKWTAKL